MDFSKINCDGCGKALGNESDEIVTCPICGTPQHRACFEKRGACVNESKHASGFVYQAPQQAETKANNEAPKPKQSSKADENVRESLANGEMPDIDDVIQQRIDAVCPGITDEQRQEQLCGADIAFTSSFVANNAAAYINKFRKMEHAKQRTFNWAGFIFGQFWLLWRKQYFFGFLFAAIQILISGVASYILAPYSDAVANIMQGDMQSMAAADLSFLAPVLPKVLLLDALVLAIHIFIGICGDKMYYNYCKQSIYAFKEIKKALDNDESVNYYLKKSSTSFLAPLFCIIATYGLTTLLSYLIP